MLVNLWPVVPVLGSATSVWYGFLCLWLVGMMLSPKKGPTTPPKKKMLKISQLKCSRCNIKVDYNDDSVDTAVATCRESGDNCGIKQMNEFMKRMEQKKNGKPKQVPAILLPHTEAEPRSIAEFEAEQRAACPELYQD